MGTTSADARDADPDRTDDPSGPGTVSAEAEATEADNSEASSASKNALTVISLPLVIVLTPIAILLDLILAIFAIVLFLVRILVRYKPVFLSMRNPKKTSRDDADSKVFDQRPAGNEPLPAASTAGIEDAKNSRKKEIAAQHRMGTSVAGFIPALVRNAKESVDKRLDVVDAEVERRKNNARSYQAKEEKRLSAAGLRGEKTGSWRAYVAVMILLGGASAPLDYEAFRYNLSFDWEVILFTVLAGVIWVFAAHWAGHLLKEHQITRGTPHYDEDGNRKPNPRFTSALVGSVIFMVILGAMLITVNKARIDSLNEASATPAATEIPSSTRSGSDGVVDLGGN